MDNSEDLIRNKIAESGLISLDLADFKVDAAKIVGIDISENLWQGLVLKEKNFREYIQSNDWEKYSNLNVFIQCTADAIVPTWAYMLIAAKIEGIVSSYLVGSKLDLEKKLIQQNISQFDINLSEYDSKRYIIKGCADISCPEFAMTELMKIIQPTAKSIMYGEPCSTVPIYKKK